MMAVATTRDGLPPAFKRPGTVFAIVIDLALERGDRDAVRRVLEGHQFQWQQGNMYLGGPAATAASVMVAVIDLTAQLPWLAAAVRDVRMLRIEELNDLMPVVRRVAGLGTD
jgi:virulence-associated protein VapD